MMRALPILLLLAAAADAHLVPIPPSVCSPDVTLAIGGGASGASAPAGAGDALRIRYDAAGGEAVFCPTASTDPSMPCASASPRPFTVGDVTGTLTLPPRFTARAYASGDLVVAETRLAFATPAGTVLAPVSFTTGLAAVGDVASEGAAIAALGRFTLLGVADAGAISPAAAGRPLEIRLVCRATPAPDVVQLPLLPEADLRGTIAARGASLRAVVSTALIADPVVAGKPVMVRVRAGDATIASAFVPAGLAGDGRRFAATSPDGRFRVSVRLRKHAGVVYSLQLDDVAMPSSPGGRALVDATLDVGGVLVRGEKLFVGDAQRLRAR